MCVSTGPAEFHGTLISIHEQRHPKHHHPIRVLIYQNTPTSNIQGHHTANAMILHFPGRVEGERNFLATTFIASCLQDMSITCASLEGLREPMVAMDRPVQVFDVGIYTVVLAKDARDIPGALHRVPAEKRPDLNPRLFDWYESQYPGWGVALCCFNNTDPKEAEPLMVWYEPFDDADMLLPGIDSHTGGVPLVGDVDLDHWLFLGSMIQRPGFEPIQYTFDYGRVGDEVHFLPRHVKGWHFNRRMQNGDFIVVGPNELKPKIDRLLITA